MSNSAEGKITRVFAFAGEAGVANSQRILIRIDDKRDGNVPNNGHFSLSRDHALFDQIYAMILLALAQDLPIGISTVSQIRTDRAANIKEVVINIDRG